MCKRSSILFVFILFLAGCTPSTTPVPRSEAPSTKTLGVQPVENSIIVTNTRDAGPGSLREALLSASEGYSITFDPAVFPPDAPVTIVVSGRELPGISVDNLTLDASNAGVVLDGSQLGGDWVAGLQIVSSERSSIMGLQISNFPGPGIAISGESRQNVIGGDRSVGAGPWGQGNLVSNNRVGVDIATAGTTQTTVTGNLIGVDLEGSSWLGNDSFGIQIWEGATENTIGPDNLIAYNGRDGIYIDSPIRTENTLIDNRIFDNAIGIGWPQPPALFDVDLAAGTVVGAACPDCTVEVYSASAYGEELEGAVFEGETTADENGVFNFDKGISFTGPFLTARTVNLRGRASMNFSYPLTSETESRLMLQVGNELPRRQYLLEVPLELADNHIAAQYDGISYGDDRSDFTYIYSAGMTRARVSIAGIEPELVDWDKPELSLSPGQQDHFNRMAEKDIIVTYVLMFWDKESYPHGEGAPCARFKTEEEIEHWLDYVRFIVEELGDRVDYFEMWNEPDIQEYCPKWIELDDYVNLIQRTVPVIREVDPKVKIAVGGVSYTYYDGAQDYLFGLLESEAMPLVDVISWHPMYGTSPKYNDFKAYYYGYPDFVQRIMDTAAASGFAGEYHADEVGWSLQPGGGQFGEYSLLETNKYVMRSVMQHRGMGIDIGLGGGYYTIRRLTTLMSGVEPVELPVEINSAADNIVSYSFSTPAGDRLIAVWTNGIAVDDDPGIEAAITIPEFSASEVIGIDLLKNLEQELILEEEDGTLVIRDLVVKDYPLIIRVRSASQ